MGKKQRVRSIEDLYENCTRREDTGCLEWNHSRDEAGYGLTTYNKKSERIHRLSYKLTHPDEDISDLHVCHRCDNPPCGNAEHLFAGTPLDNMIDRNQKGRTKGARGELSGTAKLTWYQVEEIRKRYKNEDIRQWQLGEQYGVAQGIISLIINRKIWKDESEYN